MNALDELTDEEFIPFLHALGVETYNKSFEWMLNDPDFAGVLRWLYHNLDHNNALTAREEYRYAELEQRGLLLPDEDLESTVEALLKEYPGLCLPGDQESLEDVKLNISMQKEKLQMLERHEKVYQNLLKENVSVKENLNVDLKNLDTIEEECKEEMTKMADECQVLAEEVETITDSVVHIIADKLEVYSNCHVNKDISKKFLTYGPLDAYRQTQALFKSHFDLYTTKKFEDQQIGGNDEDLRTALVEAKNLEGRLSNALYAYIDSKVDLCGEQAKLALISNYTAVHPSQVTSLTLEAQTAKELLAQEESILMQQVQDTVQELVSQRTRLVVETATKSALAVREQIVSDLSHLIEQCSHALALDRVLCCALRSELRAADQCAQFAAQLREHVAAEKAAQRARVASMNEIIAEQESCEQNIKHSDRLLHALYKILGVPPMTDAVPLVKIYGDLKNKVEELKDEVEEKYMKREQAIEEFKTSRRPLEEYIYDGCTRQPNCADRTVTPLTHTLKQEMDRVDKRVLEVGSKLTSVKNGDKHNLRKLWQWFLTDKTKFQAAVRGIQIPGTS